MRRVIIVQARMTSTRLPGKVLMDLRGRPMLGHQLRRLKICRNCDEIVVATTTNRDDDPICALADEEGVRWFRGGESDVLSRFVGAAVEASAELVVRITADCPLIDPDVSDRVIWEIETHATECDYASNAVQRTFPRGLDTEAFFFDSLVRAARLAKSRPAREHVTYFILREQPGLFLIRSVTDVEDNSDLRWTVDTPVDMAMAREIYKALELERQIVPYRDILSYVRGHPEIAAMNAWVVQKTE